MTGVGGDDMVRIGNINVRADSVAQVLGKTGNMLGRAMARRELSRALGEKVTRESLGEKLRELDDDSLWKIDSAYQKAVQKGSGYQGMRTEQIRVLKDLRGERVSKITGQARRLFGLFAKTPSLKLEGENLPIQVRYNEETKRVHLSFRGQEVEISEDGLLWRNKTLVETKDVPSYRKAVEIALEMARGHISSSQPEPVSLEPSAPPMPPGFQEPSAPPLAGSPKPSVSPPLGPFPIGTSPEVGVSPLEKVQTDLSMIREVLTRKGATKDAPFKFLCEGREASACIVEGEGLCFSLPKQSGEGQDIAIFHKSLLGWPEGEEVVYFDTEAQNPDEKMAEFLSRYGSHIEAAANSILPQFVNESRLCDVLKEHSHDRRHPLTLQIQGKSVSAWYYEKDETKKVMLQIEDSSEEGGSRFVSMEPEGKIRDMGDVQREPSTYLPLFRTILKMAESSPLPSVPAMPGPEEEPEVPHFMLDPQNQQELRSTLKNLKSSLGSAAMRNPLRFTFEGEEYALWIDDEDRIVLQVDPNGKNVQGGYSLLISPSGELAHKNPKDLTPKILDEANRNMYLEILSPTFEEALKQAKETLESF